MAPAPSVGGGPATPSSLCEDHAQQPPQGSAEQHAKKVELICRHMLMNLIVLMAPFQSRNQYIVALAGNDAAKATVWASYMSAASALLEFALNPALGRLSDRFGRKVFLMLSPMVNLVLKLLVIVTNGRSLALVAADRVVGGAITTVGGSTTCSAAFSDLLKGDGLAGAVGKLNQYAGLGVLVGPFLSGQILALTGRVRHTYLFGAVVAALQLLHNGAFFEETLEKSTPVSLVACNPLAFVKVFMRNRAVSRISLVTGLQCFPEGKALSDMNMAHTANVLRMTQSQQTAFVMAFGGSMILAGGLPRTLIPKYLSQRNFTSVSNWLTIVALTIWGSAKTAPGFFSGLVFLCPSMERRAASSAMATDLAVASGMGKGEFAGCIANWRALCVAAAPLLYGATAQRLAHRLPGAPYLAAVAIMLCTEAIFRTAPPESLRARGAA